jgi:hypothetical protein
MMNKMGAYALPMRKWWRPAGAGAGAAGAAAAAAPNTRVLFALWQVTDATRGRNRRQILAFVGAVQHVKDPNLSLCWG